MPNEYDQDWIDQQTKTMDEGTDIVKAASDEALDYVADAIENLTDKQWRKMVMETQALQMGIGVALAESLLPEVYEDMKRSLHKKIKVEKGTAEALRHIYIGRVVKNIIRSFNERD